MNFRVRPEPVPAADARNLDGVSTLPAQPTAKPRNPANRIVPPNPVQAAIVIGAFTALLYLIEAVDAVLPANLDNLGIQPRTLGGLDGILWAPLLHAGWSHLFANTVAILVFGFLAMANGIGQWVAVTVTIWLASGIGVWLTGADGVTVGASGLAFGWLAFLLVRGMFNRSLGQLAVARRAARLLGQHAARRPARQARHLLAGPPVRRARRHPRGMARHDGQPQRTTSQPRERVPIGIFDSGVGGLTVARAIADQLPGERLRYVGDTANGPYGPLPIAEVRRHALAIADELVEGGVKLLVLACNTASAACLRDARERYDIPVVEVVVPAVRRAVASTRNGRVGVIGTAGTVRSRAYDDAFAAAPHITADLRRLPAVRGLRRARHHLRPAGARPRAGLPRAAAAGRCGHRGARLHALSAAHRACCRSSWARTSRSCPAPRRPPRTSSAC